MLDGVATRGPHLAQGMDFTFAREGRGPMGLSGMIDQSMQAAQLYGMGPHSNTTPGGFELGADGVFHPTPAQSSGLGSLFSPSKPAQQSQSQSSQQPSFWFRIADAMTPGTQVPGGGAAQWWTGWIPKW